MLFAENEIYLGYLWLFTDPHSRQRKWIRRFIVEYRDFKRFSDWPAKKREQELISDEEALDNELKSKRAT